MRKQCIPYINRYVSKDQIMKWLKSPFTEREEESDEDSIKIPRGKEQAGRMDM